MSHDIAGRSRPDASRVARRTSGLRAGHKSTASLDRGVVVIRTPQRDRAAQLRDYYKRSLVTPQWSLNELLRDDIEGRRALVTWLNGACTTEERSKSWARWSPATLDEMWRLALTEMQELSELERQHERQR